jgi:hypothetical protein
MFIMKVRFAYHNELTKGKGFIAGRVDEIVRLLGAGSKMINPPNRSNRVNDNNINQISSKVPKGAYIHAGGHNFLQYIMIDQC